MKRCLPALALLAPAATTMLAAQSFTALKPVELVARFDRNGNGRLEAGERAEARAWLNEDPRRRPWLRMMRRGVPRAAPDDTATETLLPSDAKRYAKRRLYDPMVVRTLFLYMPGQNWYEELSDFYRTDVDVPGTLLADGKTYRRVGVHFRGSSSYLAVGASRKKSFNLKLDYADPKQRLRGYRTLNLLNANGDPSFVREVLFAHIAREFVPCLAANYVKLVVNGESWGVYVNAMQFNKDFLDREFGTRKGVRWKIDRNFRGVGALRDLGPNQKRYAGVYELETASDKQAWKRLTHFFEVLGKTPASDAERVIPAVLDVDEALWFIALETVFMDADGYVRQGYDYRLYEDPSGRFHPILYDNNEVLPAVVESRRATAMRARMGQLSLTTETSPLVAAENAQRPLVSKLLAVPAWRARYLAHVKTLAEHWLDWKVIGKLARRYHDLIDTEVAKDAKKLFSYEAFARSLESDYEAGGQLHRSLKTIVTARRAFLLGHASLRGPWPTLRDVEHSVAGRRLRVTARATGATRLLLWYATKRRGRYANVEMTADSSGVYSARTPELRAARRIRFYVEARDPRAGTAAFFPRKAAAGPTVVRRTRR